MSNLKTNWGKPRLAREEFEYHREREDEASDKQIVLHVFFAGTRELVNDGDSFER